MLLKKMLFHNARFTMKSPFRFSANHYALLFGLLGGSAVILMIQFLDVLPDFVRLIPYTLTLLGYMLAMKFIFPDITFRALVLGAGLMAVTATVLLYGYVIIFSWLSPTSNPLGLSIPFWDHLPTLLLSICSGVVMGAVFAFLIGKKPTLNWSKS